MLRLFVLILLATAATSISYAYDAGAILVGGVGNANEHGGVYPKARKEPIAVGGTGPFDDGQSNEGAAFVYHGSAKGPALPPPTSGCPR